MRPILRSWRKPCIRVLGSWINPDQTFSISIQVEKTKKTKVLHGMQACMSLVKLMAYPQVYRISPQLP